LAALVRIGWGVGLTPLKGRTYAWCGWSVHESGLLDMCNRQEFRQLPGLD